jgi:signal peptidase I
MAQIERLKPSGELVARRNRIRNETLQVALVALTILAARSSLADPYVVPSGSMEHTIQVGDHVFVDKLVYGKRVPFTDWEISSGVTPGRGEVVIFDSPENGVRLIKRIVAIGGDEVSLRAGELRVNGRSVRDRNRRHVAVQEGHVALLDLRLGGGPDLPRMRIPSGKVLVLGDSRAMSHDGRYFGLIDQADIYGKATGVIYRRGEGLVWKDL